MSKKTTPKPSKNPSTSVRDSGSRNPTLVKPTSIPKPPKSNK